MILIPADSVLIGSPAQHLDAVTADQHFDRPWFEDEAPQHPQTIAPFWIDRSPVTNRAFAEFIDATGHVTKAEKRGFGLVYTEQYWTKQPGVCWRYPAPGLDSVTERPDHPAVHVDHADAIRYAVWAGKRLPSEAEWEYAAHGPGWSAWPWGNEWDAQRANTAEYWAGEPMRDANGWKRWWVRRYAQYGFRPATTSVGRYASGNSPFGVTDMAGNVAEWTASRYGPYDLRALYDEGYRAAMRHGYVVVRGGSWKHFRFQVRTSERIACTPDYSSFDVGFRCAADPEHVER